MRTHEQGITRKIRSAVQLVFRVPQYVGRAQAPIAVPNKVSKWRKGAALVQANGPNIKNALPLQLMHFQ